MESNTDKKHDWRKEVSPGLTDEACTKLDAVYEKLKSKTSVTYDEVCDMVLHELWDLPEIMILSFADVLQEEGIIVEDL